EDETGIANLIVWPAMFERFRRVVLTGALIVATGRLQRERSVIHIVVDHLADHSARLKSLTEPRPDHDPERAAKRALARADIARSGGPDPRDHAMIAQYQRLQRDDPAEQIRRLSRDFH